MNQIVKGKIKSVDSANHRIVVAHEDTFELPKSFDAKRIKVGETINLSYEVKDGHINVHDIKLVS